MKTVNVFSKRFLVVIFIGLAASTARAQTAGSGYFTDPTTGLVYQQIQKTVQQPRVETKMETQEQTVYRPETVKETYPETKTMLTPVTKYQWQAYLEGRWNIFRQPTVAYRQVPYTEWQAQTQTINRTATRTNYVPEKRTVQVPHRIVKMENKQVTEFEVVGRVAPKASPTAASTAIASRLRPLASNESVQPLGAGQTMIARAPGAITTLPSVPRIASTTVGRLTSDPPRRSVGQGGMRANELYYHSPSGYGQALPPTTGGVGIANLPGLPLWR